MEEIVPGYTVERELMRKGLRATVQARDNETGRSVVAKIVVLPPGEAAANAARARHRHLVEKIQKLVGEEFVPILSWGEEAGKLYLIREHAVGMTLAEVLSTVKRLPVELAGLLFREIVQAVQKAHAQGIAHLDLTLANIVFRQDGKLVFTDWVKEEEGSPASPAAEGVQWFWQKADQNLDLFAMGILFAKVLVGDPGLGSDATEAEIVVNLSQKLGGDPSISERMMKIIHKLLGEEFERYGGAEEVQKDLEGYIQQLGEFDPQVAWQRFLDGPAAFVEQLNQWKANQITREAKGLLDKGRIQEAKAEFERALAIDPNCSEAEAELEFLGAKEGLSVEKLTAQPKPAARPPAAGLFEKLRTSGSLPVTPAPLEDGKPIRASSASAEQIPDQAKTAPSILAEGEPKTAPEPVTDVLRTEAQAQAAPEAEKTVTEEVSVSIHEAPEVQTLSLIPLPEKPGEDEKAGIGFEEAVTKLPAGEPGEDSEEGMGALEVPQKIGAEEFVAMARGERRVPWKALGFTGIGIVALVGALFLIRALNQPKEKEKDAEALYQEALRSQEVGDFERALAKFDQVARGYSQSPKARLAMSSAADLEWRLGRTDKALGHYQTVGNGNPEDSLGREARFHRALILREQKKDAEALAELAGFILDSTAAQRTLEAKMMAAQILHTTGLADSALGVYGLALSLDKEKAYTVQMHKERGLIFEEKGDWRAARAEYDAILAMTMHSDLSHVWAEGKASEMANRMMGRGR